MAKKPLEGCPYIFAQGPPSSKLRHCEQRVLVLFDLVAVQPVHGLVMKRNQNDVTLLNKYLLSRAGLTIWWALRTP